MGRWLLSAVLCAFAAPARGQAARTGAYDVFPTAAIGTARTVALGGATNAVDPDGYEAVFANPAAMSGMAGTGLDFGSDGNTVDNTVVDVNNPSARALDVPFKYSYGGARYVTSSGWGIGAAVSTPFNYDDEFDGATQIVNKRQAFVQTGDQNDVHTEGASYAVGGGRSFLNGKLGVGASVSYVSATTDYRFTPVVTSSAPFERSASNDAFALGAGLLGAPYRWLRVGVLFRMGYRIPFDASHNAGLPVNFAAFQDLKSPDRLTLGLRLAPYDNIRLFLQGRLVFGMNNTFISGSGAFPSAKDNTVASGQTTRLDGGWGIEYVPYDVDDLTIKLRAGGYFENTGLEGGYTRYHRTAGFAFEPWCFSLSMAIDDAEFYNNFVIGFGVDLLSVAKRTSKMYGWNLPL
jgi:hypothetical protein